MFFLPLAPHTYLFPNFVFATEVNLFEFESDVSNSLLKESFLLDEDMLLGTFQQLVDSGNIRSLSPRPGMIIHASH